MSVRTPSSVGTSGGEATAVSTRPWSGDDAAWYVGHLDAEILRWTLEPSDLDVDSWRVELSSGTRNGVIWHAIECCGEIVGSVKAVPMSDHVAISYWIAPEQRGKGYASQALAQMTKLAVRSGWGRPIELEIHTSNEGSVRTAERAGYDFFEMRATCTACADDTGRSAIYRWPE